MPVAELDRVPLRVAISPLPTAFTLTRDALQGGRRGTPARWRTAIVARLRTRDVEAFAPLTDTRTTGWPTLLDDVRAPSETLDEALDRVAATPATALMDALENDRDVTATRAWDPLRRDPDRWLGRYVDALHRGRRGWEPLWRRSAAVLEHETERIGAAIDRGVPTSQIATELNKRSSLVDGVWRIPAGPDPRRLGVDEHGLIVSPMVASPKAGTVSSPRDVCVQLAYSLPGVWRVFDDEAPPPASLHALLGVQRTLLLQRLDQPHTPGRLAEILRLSPSAITFHLRALEAAGLVYRERHGRNIIVRRTARGTHLLALYALP